MIRSLLLFMACSLRLAGFQVVDRFDDLAPGPLAQVSGGVWQSYPAASQPMVVATAEGGNHVVFGKSTAGGPFVSIHRALPAAAAIPATGLSTFYFRVRPGGARIDHSIGLVDGLSAEPTFGDLHPQVVFLNAATNGATAFRVAARSGGSTFDVLASAPKGQWYDFWIVMDRARGSYDVWYSADGGHPVLLANDYAYRTASSAPFTSVLCVSNGQNTDDLSIGYDGFHSHPGRMDLSRPSRPGIQPAPLRVVTFNARSGNGTNLASLRDNYLNGEHVICLQEVQQADWNSIQQQFPNHPHRLLTVKKATKFLSFKTECLAILSSLPFLETDAAIMQIDPQVDMWERWAQYVKVDLGGGTSARIFHFHNTYNFDENNFQYEKSGMVKFRDWILLKTGAASVANVPDLIALGDFNLTNPSDVTAILAMPMVRSNGRDYLMANPAAKASTTLWTSGVLSDHNGLAASLAPLVRHDRYAFWASAAFSDAELRAGLGAPGGDADGDGLDHFTEYAWNLNPWRRDEAVGTAVSGSSLFRRGAGRADVVHAIESTGDLVEWSDVAVATNGGPMTATAAFAVSDETTEDGETTISTVEWAEDEPRRFFRQKAVPVPVP